MRAGGKDHVARRGVLAQRVAAAGEMLGVLLSLGAEHPSTRLLLERAAPAIALSLAEERAAGEATRRARDAFLVDLLTHPAATEQDERRQLRLAGLSPGTMYCIAVATAAGPDTPIRTALETLPLPPGTVAAEHGSRALAVVPAEDSASAQAVFTSGPLDATIGIAEPARGAKALAHAYVEAQQTVDVLDTLGRAGEVSSARGLGIYRILLSHMAREHLDELTEAELGPLMRSSPNAECRCWIRCRSIWRTAVTTRRPRRVSASTSTPCTSASTRSIASSARTGGTPTRLSICRC